MACDLSEDHKLLLARLEAEVRAADPAAFSPEGWASIAVLFALRGSCSDADDFTDRLADLGYHVVRKVE